MKKVEDLINDLILMIEGAVSFTGNQRELYMFDAKEIDEKISELSEIIEEQDELIHELKTTVLRLDHELNG